MRWASDQPIPQLTPVASDPPADLVVWQQQRPEPADDAEPFPPLGTKLEPLVSPCRVVRFRSSGRYQLTYSDGSEFHVDAAGKEVWATWPSPMTAEDMATYLLGPVVGFVLRLRGVLALHASSVLIDDVAIAIVGPAGAGKSTTAAAFAQRGFAVLADDVSALDLVDGSYWVRPAYPHLRLWPQSVVHLYGNAESLAPITPNWDKRDLPLASLQRFHDQPARLAAIYLLDARSDAAEAPFLASLPGTQRFLALVTNTYRNDLIDVGNRAGEFVALTPLLECVPVRRVTPHSDPQRIGALCDLLVNDVRQLVRAAPRPALPRGAAAALQ
jgi:hypothetical protein